MAQSQSTNNNTDIVAIIKNICHHEELKQSFNIMRPISKGQQGGAVFSVLAPVELESTAMYADVIPRNKLNLHQAWETPCAHGPIKNYLGHYGLGQGAQDILDNKFDPNIAANLPALNNWLCNKIRQVAAQVSLKVDLTLDNYKALFKSQDKSTSSSSLGCHYGQYRAALVSNSISQVHATMMPLPFPLGFAPYCWQTAIDIMLEKDIGSPKIACLRIIVIVEGDMNAIMKVIWNRCLVPVVEKTVMLSPVQFGNQQGCTALDVLLLKAVTMDCLQLYCLNGAISNNDATACYD
eukprot:7886698-Ditylum_brightwellii.AAC.1